MQSVPAVRNFAHVNLFKNISSLCLSFDRELICNLNKINALSSFKPREKTNKGRRLLTSPFYFFYISSTFHNSCNDLICFLCFYVPFHAITFLFIMFQSVRNVAHNYEGFPSLKIIKWKHTTTLHEIIYSNNFKMRHPRWLHILVIYSI